MPDLPKKKVGIVSCSGEEIAEGTVTRLAALRVLEQLRPGDTVTICLPLFLAGGEGDRAFARFYPTIAIDGCEKRCAARGTEMYSGKPAASLLVTDIVAENGLNQPQGRSRLNEAGMQAVDLTAQKIAATVDGLLGKSWDRRAGQFLDLNVVSNPQAPAVATCSCGSGIPVQTLEINGQAVTLVALPLIFERLHQAGKMPSEETNRELLETVRIYNPVPAGEETAYAAVLVHEYTAYCERQKVTR
ncbi:MAG: putative zinc-binding protein [Bacteroidota bacterium]